MWDMFIEKQKKWIKRGCWFLAFGLICSFLSGLIVYEKEFAVFYVNNDFFIVVTAFLRAIGSPQVGAWVQAIGSVLAILAAVWIMHRQHEQQIKRDEEEIKNMLFGIRSEIEFYYEGKIKGGIGESITTRIPDGGQFKEITNLSTNSSYIYYSQAKNIGKIKNAALRSQIIEAYSSIFDLEGAVTLNNQVASNYFYIRTNLPAFNEDMENLLRSSANTLKNELNKAKPRIEKLLEMLPKEGQFQ